MSESLGEREVRRCYLITYSRANDEKFPTRESFAEAVNESFSEGKSKAKVVHWVCGKEAHSDTGFHYHMAIKFSGGIRWLRAKNYLSSKHGVTVNFSEGEKYHNYYSAYKYVTKEDSRPLHSDHHPDLKSATSPRTSRGSKQLMKRKRQGAADSDATNELPGPSRQKSKRRLSNLDVADAIIEKNIKDDRELYALAQEQKEEGKDDLAAFILGRSQKSVNELISSAWKMKDAAATIARSQASRISRIQTALAGQCTPDCKGQWFMCAKQVLRNNDVNVYVFAAAVRELLIKGRGKYRNLMIVGPANCGKTFLLDPLNIIYDTFTNPANSSYAWLGAETKEVIFLNDFRYTNEKNNGLERHASPLRGTNFTSGRTQNHVCPGHTV